MTEPAPFGPPTPVPGQTCGNCLYYLSPARLYPNYGTTAGECHAEPPTVTNVWGVWPQVTPSQWCGIWKQAPPPASLSAGAADDRIEHPRHRIERQGHQEWRGGHG